ncbi:MAG: M56 family metallopeptidase, partial [Holophagae bacterium]
LATRGRTLPPVDDAIALLWAGVAVALVGHQLVALWRMHRLVRRASIVTAPDVLALAARVRRQVGCRRRVRLVVSSELDIPAVFGTLRPVLMLPVSSHTWLEDRLTAVLQHELVHVIRFDWVVRTVARLACAVYWFNPLVWWAGRRLDLEQELACDEEVLAFGSRASTYACHLLGIARIALHHRAPAAAGLGMARRSHLEERIMTILNRPSHRRVGLAVILPAAVITAALVPAIAAVQPAEPGAKPASPELKAALADMKDAEQRLEPFIEQIERQKDAIEPELKEIENLRVDIDEEALARIQAEMAPILEQIEAVQVDMTPVHEQLEAMQDAFQSMKIHVEDGTFEEIQQQIQAQIEAHMGQLERIQLDMEPYHAQLEALHAQLEPLTRQIEAIHVAGVPSQEQLERIQRQMEPFHEEMERLQRQMEPLSEEVERIGARVESALRTDVEQILRSELGAVTGPDAPFGEAAERIVDEASIHIDDDVLELDVSRREVREILSDLLGPARIGTEEAFDGALERTVDEVATLEIAVD